MATSPIQLGPAEAYQLLPPPPSEDETADAVFELSKPITIIVDGVPHEVAGLGMRQLGLSDLLLLDQHLGQPIALAKALVGSLCDLGVESVCQLSLDDFAMLAADALFQVEQFSQEMGLPERFFLQQSSGNGPIVQPELARTP